MLKLLTVLVIFVLYVHANTEAFFFNTKEIPLGLIDKSLLQETAIVLPDIPNAISIKVNAPNKSQSNTYLYPISPFTSTQYNRYNAKVSWSALDPINVLKFDIVQGDERPFILLTVQYDCFTKDVNFMSQDHDVDVIIMLDPCVMGLVPKSLIPVVIQIVLVGLLSVFVLSPAVYKYLVYHV